LAAGNTPPQIIQAFSDLAEQDIAACLDFARDLAEYEVVAS